MLQFRMRVQLKNHLPFPKKLKQRKVDLLSQNGHRVSTKQLLKNKRKKKLEERKMMEKRKLNRPKMFHLKSQSESGQVVRNLLIFNIRIRMKKHLQFLRRVKQE